MIKRLNIKNFKSFAEIDLELKNFNVVVGGNASGKSNFVSAFSFLKNFSLRGFKDAVSSVGGAAFFKNISLKHQPTSLELDMAPIFTGATKLKINKDGKTWYKLKIEIDGEDCDKILSYRLMKFENSDIVGEADLLKLSSSEILKDLNEINDELKKRQYLDLLSMFHLFEELGSISLFHSIKVFDFDLKACKKAIPLGYSSTLNPDGENLSIVLREIFKNAEQKSKFLHILNFVLPFIKDIEFELLEMTGQLFFRIKEEYNDAFIPANLISDGTLNILLLIISLFFETQETVVIEEPTKELHPKLIPAIVDLLKDASKKKQVIITTQNPELIKYVDLDDLIFVSRANDGFSKIERLSNKQKIKAFLENEIGLDELFIQNIFEGVT